MLALLLVHAAHDGGYASTEFGAFCLAVAGFLGLLLLERLRSQAPEALIRIRGDRGPPAAPETQLLRPAGAAVLPSPPLRR